MQAKNVVTYAESDAEDDDDEDVFDPRKAKEGRGRKRRKISPETDDDIFVEDAEVEADLMDEGSSHLSDAIHAFANEMLLSR